MSYPFSSSPTFGNNKGIWKAKPSSAALPLYKDKPINQTTNYSTIINNKGNKRIKMLFPATVLFFIIYLLYQFGKSFKNEEDGDNTDLWLVRKFEVKTAFLESWHDYEKNGWGYDVYHPISQKGENMGPKPLGWIIVDSLDTLMLMNCEDELKRARAWVKDELTYDFNYEVNVFETTIRMLGGFLSAYYISEDDLYLDKAVDLGGRILKSFDSRTGIPYASVNLGTGRGVKSHADGGASSTAEVSTLQLEFKYLAKLTGESLYWEKVEKVMEVLDANKPKDGLVPIFVHPETGKYQGKLIRLGSRGDSYYEYLLKQYLQTGETIYRDMYEESVKGVKKNMLGKSSPNGYTYIGELPNGINGGLDPKMDHLVCFMGGLLALGATEGANINVARKTKYWSTTQESSFTLGKEISRTCYKMYHDVEHTGLAPEIVVFNQDQKSINDFHIKPLDRHNLQRPETVESLYYLYKITGDPMYRRWGYEIFQNFIKHTKVEHGGIVRYTSLDDVTTGKKRDNMESFWLAETLKYLYLLFDDEDPIDLTKCVFNTEAHIFPDFDMAPLFKTGWSRSGQVKEEAGDKIEEPAKDVKSELKVKPNAIKQELDLKEAKPVLKSTDQEDDILNPKMIPPKMMPPKMGGSGAKAEKPKIQAEISFNENDKKSHVNQDAKVLKNVLQQLPLQQLRQLQQLMPDKKLVPMEPPLEGQKPSKPIEEELRELNLDKDEGKGKKLQDKNSINKKLEELINNDIE